jgi:putative endonuclease
VDPKLFTVYVIVSLGEDLFYIGQTRDLLRRYRQHADGNNRSTRRLRPHVVGHVEFFHTRAEAMRREKQLKTAAGRAWVKTVVIANVRNWYRLGRELTKLGVSPI